MLGDLYQLISVIYLAQSGMKTKGPSNSATRAKLMMHNTLELKQNTSNNLVVIPHSLAELCLGCKQNLQQNLQHHTPLLAHVSVPGNDRLSDSLAGRTSRGMFDIVAK